MARLRLLCLLLILAPAIAAHAAAPDRSVGTCSPTLPPLLGGCGARSPYTVEIRAGISGFGPGGASGRYAGWIGILNTGPVMPHLVVEVDTHRSFTAQNIYAAVNTGKQRYRQPALWIGPHRSPYFWNFGHVPDGAVVSVHFRMHLTNGCSYQMQIRTYGNTLPDGSVNAETATWGGESGQGGEFGNCPFPR